MHTGYRVYVIVIGDVPEEVELVLAPLVEVPERVGQPHFRLAHQGLRIPTDVAQINIYYYYLLLIYRIE